MDTLNVKRCLDISKRRWEENSAARNAIFSSENLRNPLPSKCFGMPVVQEILNVLNKI